ncbi:MAG TPA: hypothetical protein VFA07_18900 [Chthonomonadaceae bacterium]|nr:hypothetical protein [Chthonomonadaceae bacterium]
MEIKVTPDTSALPREHEPRVRHAGASRRHRTTARRAGRLILKDRNHSPENSLSSPGIGHSGGKRLDDPACAFEQKVQSLTEAMIAASGGESLSLAARFRILTEAIAHVSAESGQQKPKAASMPPEQTTLLYEMLKAVVEADKARAANDWPAAIQYCNLSLERLRELARVLT